MQAEIGLHVGLTLVRDDLPVAVIVEVVAHHAIEPRDVLDLASGPSAQLVGIGESGQALDRAHHAGADVVEVGNDGLQLEEERRRSAMCDDVVQRAFELGAHGVDRDATLDGGGQAVTARLAEVAAEPALDVLAGDDDDAGGLVDAEEDSMGLDPTDGAQRLCRALSQPEELRGIARAVAVEKEEWDVCQRMPFGAWG